MNPAAIATSQPANAPARDMTTVNAAGPLSTLGDSLTSLPLLPLAPAPPGWDGRTELRQGPRDKPPLAGSYRPDAEAPRLERLAMASRSHRRASTTTSNPSTAAATC